MTQPIFISEETEIKMRDNYDRLLTEQRNPRTLDIDKLPTRDMVELISRENRAVDLAIDGVIPKIAEAIDVIAEAMNEGHCLIYVGAGTSGRLGVVDASECPPTFGVDPHLVRGIIAGGRGAMFAAVEGAEDNAALGAESIDADGVEAGDVVVGISASGRAPFVLGALARARELGAHPIGLCCMPDSAMVEVADIVIDPYVGPEVISGSTRLKAGTAQKLVLNMLSTGAMIRTGRVRSNYMINVRPTNEKLTERAVRMIMELSGLGREEATRALELYGDVPTALSALGIR